MTTVEFITELFYLADEKLKNEPQHSQAKLAKSEIVTLALLFALEGREHAAFLSLAEASLSAAISKVAGANETFPAVQEVSLFGK